MKNSYKLSFAAIAASMVLVGCTGGDDSESFVPTSWTGQFVDTYVKGLNYTCTGKVWDADGQDTGETTLRSSGVTNDKGEFFCSEGDVVEFSIGKYVIGQTYAWNSQGREDGIKTPYDLSSGVGAINIAQLIQTIDDKSVNGVLTIPDNFSALDGVDVALTDEAFDTLMADVLNVTALVSEEDAEAHLVETLSTLTSVDPTPTEPTPEPTTTNLYALLAGKTVYGENNYDAWTFNDTLTQISIIDVDALPGSVPEVIDITVINGNIILVNDGSGTEIEALYQTTDIKLTWIAGPETGMVDNIWFDLATLESVLSM